MFHISCVDYLPEDDRHPYSCSGDGKPRQIAFAMDYWDNDRYIKLLNTSHYICMINSRYTVLQFNIITGQSPDTFSVVSAQFRPMIFNKLTAIQIYSGAGVVRTISFINVSYSITWQWPELSTTISHRSFIVHGTRRFPTKKPNPILTGRRIRSADRERCQLNRKFWFLRFGLEERVDFLAGGWLGRGSVFWGGVEWVGG